MRKRHIFIRCSSVVSLQRLARLRQPLGKHVTQLGAGLHGLGPHHVVRGIGEIQLGRLTMNSTHPGMDATSAAR